MGGQSTNYGSSRGYDWSDSKSVTRRSARSYAQDDRRRYTGSSEGLGAPVGKEIKTNSKLAAILVVDVTGSMHTWPQLIFEKIPTLYTECNAVLQGLELDELKKKGKNIEDLLEMAVIAVGDAQGDSSPLQVLDFSKGADLVKGVNKIYPEGNGGGNAKESYDLAAYFILNHCKTPKVSKEAKPLVIIAGDEGFYEKIKVREVKDLIGDNLTKSLDTSDVIKKLTKKYDTYILRPEEHYDAGTYARIHNQWQKALGAQRALKMDNPQRLVDCIIGICAYASDNFKIGEDMLKRRQTPEQVTQVLETLHPLLKK